MTKTIRKVVLILIVAVSLLTGCGRTNTDHGTSTSQVTAEGTLANVAATETPLYGAFEAGWQASLGSGGSFPPPPLILPTPLGKGAAALSTPNWNCANVTASGDLSDPDDDGIPANGRFAGTCTITKTGLGTLSWNLNFTVQDTNNNDPLSGLKTNGSISWELKDKWEVKWTASEHSVQRSSLSYKLVYKGGWEYTDYIDPNQSGAMSYDLSGNWTPDNQNINFAHVWSDGGTIQMHGKVSSSGDCTANADFGFEVHFNKNGCADRGQMQYSGNDCSGRVCDASVSWSSCNGPYSSSGGCR